MGNKELFELTNPQKSIWYTEQFYEGTTVNNICVSGTLYGKIDEELLKQAINNVVKQNDSFRIHVIQEKNDWEIEALIDDSNELSNYFEYDNSDLIQELENVKEEISDEDEITEKEDFKLLESDISDEEIVDMFMRLAE